MAKSDPSPLELEPGKRAPEFRCHLLPIDPGIVEMIGHNLLELGVILWQKALSLLNPSLFFWFAGIGNDVGIGDGEHDEKRHLRGWPGQILIHARKSHWWLAPNKHVPWKEARSREECRIGH
jgi:hypothetical protein